MYTHANMCWADTETRSECPITRGTWNYAQHPSTEVIMMQWAFDSGLVQVWETGDPLPFELFQWINAGKPIAFHHAAFDYNIFRFAGIRDEWGKFKALSFYADMKLPQVHDTMAWLAAANLPQKLDTACKVLGLPPEFHKASGMALINKFCKPRKASKKNPEKWWTKETAPEKWQDFRFYGAQDIVAMRMAASYVPQLTPYERAVWEHTYTMNDRGVPVSVDECQKVIAIVEQEKAALNERAARISGGAFDSVTEKQKVKDWMREVHGIELINAEGKVTIAAEYVDKALDDPALPFDVRTVLNLSKAVNQTSVKKFDKMLEIASPDGTIKGMYAYHGAGTGRYASKGGLNLQNLKRPVIKDPEAALKLFASVPYGLIKSVYPRLMDAATSCIRSALKAPDGFDFINEDYSSIENRCANWFAGQDDVVQGYADGLDEYKLLAVDMYKVAYDDVTKDQRQVAKAGVLGGQFGQGYKGFIAFAEGYGVYITKKESKAIIKAYRDSHDKVRTMWYELGDIAVQAVRNPGTRFPTRGKGYIYYDLTFLCAELPSGRVIKWFKPQISSRPGPPVMTYKADDREYEDYIALGLSEHDLIAYGHMYPRRMRNAVTVLTKDRDGHAWYRQVLIGSSIFQSFVQGMARDLLVHGMLNLEAAGYPVVLTTHDEAQSLQPIGTGSEEEFDRHFCNLPEWAAGLPVIGESWRGERYRK